MLEPHITVPRKAGFLIPLAWATILLVSLLPDILFRQLTGSLPAWLFWAKTGFLGGLCLASAAWKPLRALWLFFCAALAVCLLGWGVDRAFQALGYIAWFGGMAPFLRDLFAVQIPRATAAVLLALGMLALTGSFSRFFLVKGKLDAQAAPIPLIMTRPSSWRVLGPAVAGAMCLGLAVFTLAFGKLPSFQALSHVLPLLPFVVLFAASNAFGEEMFYHAAWLGALEGPVGPVHTLLMTAVYFGLGHYYGVPYGILGVIMAFIPGWLMGKAMLETRGFFWAWTIHICMDAVIFFFMALGAVTPGG